MSSLSYREKQRFEKLLGMSSGYVSDFSNRTFEEFVWDSVRKEIYDDAYKYSSGSKANRLRAFWDKEPDHVVAKLLGDLVDYARDLGAEAGLIEGCREAVDRLKTSAPVADLDAIVPNAEGREFEVLAEAVKKSIEANEPEVGVDRLHTFTMKYLRVLCEQRGISTEKNKPLHSLLGELIKRLKAEGLVQSAMAERILKSTISTLESFNTVRNDQSLAHDNEILTYDEALLIFNHVSSAIRFLGAIVGSEDDSRNDEQENDDLPF
jgi:hypothetical protein